MGIKQTFEKLRQARADHISAENRSNSTFGELPKRNREKEAQRVATEAGRRLIEKPSLSTNRVTGESRSWGEVQKELEPLAGHLIVVSSLHHALDMGYIEGVAKRMKDRVGPRDAVVGFSVHCSKYRQQDDEGVDRSFLRGAQELRRRMAEQGFDVLAGDIAAPEQENGVGLKQIAQSGEATHQSAEEEGKDYLHVAVVGGQEMDEIGIGYASPDSQLQPYLLLGFNDGGKPKWTNIYRPSPNNET